MKCKPFQMVEPLDAVGLQVLKPMQFRSTTSTDEMTRSRPASGLDPSFEISKIRLLVLRLTRTCRRPTIL
jgi:hypothetical protein